MSLKNWVLITITVTLTLLFSISHSFAWHENLGIDANKAAELYQTKPNDPAIVQWKNALQLAINDMGKCFDIETAIGCESLMSTINSNCKSHPNELLACNDVRIAQYPLILKQAQEAQKKAEAEQKKAEEEQQKAEQQRIKDAQEAQRKAEEQRIKKIAELKEDTANKIINTCVNTNSDITCDGKFRFLQSDCLTNSSSFKYCKDERFIGYLTKHNIILNSTAPNSTALP